MTSAANSTADQLEAVRYGPDGEPEHTLGWVAAAWAQTFLQQPDGPGAGEPWRFTGEQLRFVLWWYAIDPDGRFLYRRGTLRRCKGWGKDPLAAVLCLIEAAGPCRFDGWARGGETTDWGYQYEAGEPLARAETSPWVQVAAVAREQTSSTFRLFAGLVGDDTRARYRIGVYQALVHVGDAVIKALANQPLSAEGPRPTFVVRNETQNWLEQNDGHEMAETIDGNLAKSRSGTARALSLCNAHIPGRDSVAEREWAAFRKIEDGASRATGVLYDSVEAPPDIDLADEESLRRGLDLARGDSTWSDLDRLIGEVWDPQTTPSEARRKYLNQVTAAEDAWTAPQSWDVLADPGLSLEPGEQITLGFDGSKSDDHCGLIACRVSDGAWFTLGIWDPDAYGGEAPRELIDGTVQHARGTYDVVGFYSDLHPFESYVDKWAEDFRGTLCVKATPRHPIAWDMRSRVKEFTLHGAMRVQAAINDGTFRHDGNPMLRGHVHNARRNPNASGVSFAKEHRESARKVDGLAAGILAAMCRADYLALPRHRQRRRGAGRAEFV